MWMMWMRRSKRNDTTSTMWTEGLLDATASRSSTSTAYRVSADRDLVDATSVWTRNLVDAISLGVWTWLLWMRRHHHGQGRQFRQSLSVWTGIWWIWWMRLAWGVDAITNRRS
jgi:hypothetical protein